MGGGGSRLFSTWQLSRIFCKGGSLLEGDLRLSKSIKLQDAKYWDLSSISYNNQPLSSSLSFKLLLNKGIGYSTSYNYTLESPITVIFMYHTAHGSCGGLYIIWKGASSGNALLELQKPSHGKLSLNGNVVTFTSDTWGSSVRILTPFF